MYRVVSGLAPHILTTAMTAQRFLVPEDSDAIDRLYEYLKTVMPTLREIKQVVIEFYALEPTELIKKSSARRAEIVFARHVFCYFARHYTHASLADIGRRVGYSDHSCAHHGVRRIQQLAVTRPLVRDDLDLMRLRLCDLVLHRTRSNGQC